MKVIVFLCLIYFAALACTHKPDCECGSTTPAKVAQAQSKPTETTETETKKTEAPKATEKTVETSETEAKTSTTEVSSKETCPVIEATTQTGEAIVFSPKEACLAIQAETVSIYQFTPTPAISATSKPEMSSASQVSASTSAPPTTAFDMITIDAATVSVSGNQVEIQDDRFTQLVLSCTGEYTEVTINIVLHRAYIAESLLQACQDFYFLTADGKRSQTFHWPQ